MRVLRINNSKKGLFSTIINSNYQKFNYFADFIKLKNILLLKTFYGKNTKLITLTMKLKTKYRLIIYHYDIQNITIK